MSQVLSFFGGTLIGAAALLLYAVEGRIAGVSGIVFNAMNPDGWWRWLFIAGLVLGGWLAIGLGVPVPHFEMPSTTRGLMLLILAGVLVGLGTRLANGCTSGHGICGVSRFSSRSIVAVLTFVSVGMATATLMQFAGV